MSFKLITRVFCFLNRQNKNYFTTETLKNVFLSAVSVFLNCTAGVLLYRNISKQISLQKINSSNLYQLFSYLKNQETDSKLTLNCEGILLYPSIQNDFVHSYKYENHRIRVMSVNLNQEWQNIMTDLLKIIV
ncbi:MAG: hypothetical protein EA393_07305 [Bacteroidetes bacterium]|nr:MAG: hypothetical protein EA393_07305 [Bacteroidota bacterium]